MNIHGKNSSHGCRNYQYQLTYQVENFGEYALRGGIVDIFPMPQMPPIVLNILEMKLNPFADLILRLSNLNRNWIAARYFP